ncbi:uncharacterized protein SCHCODRAFT_02692719 [Schizophyllum commune H4-8]|nr:uncharacterized protein SCHCODRAFT_02692719 [Schizophyllum commune H4-8]KAI5886878.1 hypothetical protein SCHCODRAFT_02692719 [Schizophyllum commune H4-8]
MRSLQHKASVMAIIAQRMSVRLPKSLIPDEELLRWLVPPAPGDASYRPHERAGFVFGHDDGSAPVQLANSEEGDEEWVRARADTREGSVRRSIGFDAIAHGGIQRGATLEVAQRYDVVYVFSFWEFIALVSASLERKHCKQIKYLQEMLARPKVGNLIVLGHLIHGVQNFLRRHQDPLEISHRRSHVFTDCEKCQIPYGKTV